MRLQVVALECLITKRFKPKFPEASADELDTAVSEAMRTLAVTI